MSIERIPIAAIVLRPDFQLREKLEPWKVEEYAAIFDRLPPVTVARIDDTLYLVAGFHRIAAAERLNLAEIQAEIIDTDEDGAYEIAVTSNATHGLHLKTKEKKAAAAGMLRRFTERSDRWIGEDCGLSDHTVKATRDELEAGAQIAHLGYSLGRDGKRYGCDCSRCKPPLLAPEPTPEPLPEPDAEPEPETSWTVGPVSIYEADASALTTLDLAPVHLVITSPPYNVGIDYSEHDDTMPQAEYFRLLRRVWRQCFDVLVDGGRIAVVVPFGVGRNPWTPLAAQVADTLTEIGFTIRGQVIWDKGTSGNRTSWGSFRLPTDPSLRDTCEAILIAHKGQSKLDVPAEVLCRDSEGSYSPWLETRLFMELAQDHWAVAPESASRVGHPAPFPVELVERLMRFYAYPGAHVLDPFAGSGTVGVAGIRLGCQVTLVEIDHAYCGIAQERCRREFQVPEFSKRTGALV